MASMISIWFWRTLLGVPVSPLIAPAPKKFWRHCVPFFELKKTSIILIGVGRTLVRGTPNSPNCPPTPNPKNLCLYKVLLLSEVVLHPLSLINVINPMATVAHLSYCWALVPPTKINLCRHGSTMWWLHLIMYTMHDGDNATGVGRNTGLLAGAMNIFCIYNWTGSDEVWLFCCRPVDSWIQ